MSKKAGPREFGYARGIVGKQDPQPDVDALVSAGVVTRNIRTEGAVGSRKAFSALAGMLSEIRKGDVVVVCEMDRLGRSLSQILGVVAKVHDVGAGLRVLSDGIDTSGPGALMLLKVFASIRKAEQSVSRQQWRRSQRSGIVAGRKVGLVGGRRQMYSDEQIKAAMQDIQAGSTVEAAALKVTNDAGAAISTTRLRVRLKELAGTKK